MLNKSRATAILSATVFLLPLTAVGGKSCPLKIEYKEQFSGAPASAEAIAASQAKGTHDSGGIQRVTLQADGSSPQTTIVIRKEQ
jgi:hypothetical protein